MTAENPADTVIEQAAKVLHDMNGCGDPYGTCVSTSEYYRGEARALHDAGLLADPADRDWQMCDQDACEYTAMFKARAERAEAELEAWRSGRRRKSWPSIESVPDGLHYAAELVRAQGTEGGDAHDALLREAAARLKALNDIAPVLLAEKERAEAEVARLTDARTALAAALNARIDSAEKISKDVMAERDELRATIERVATLHDRWAILAGQAMNADTREWLDAASKSLRAALDGAGEQ